MISPERLDAMQGRFVHLMSTWNIAPVDAYPVFDQLVAAYSEPTRHYHNLEHLAEMFKVVGRLAEQAINLPAIYLAVWFHDAVYDSHAKDNEARSADLATTLLQPLGIPTATLEVVGDLILATGHDPLPPSDVDTTILLDADLAILAAEEKRYRRYAAAIRQEYAWVDDVAYRVGRAAVLRRFLDRPRLYYTERMHAVGDEPARANMRTELEALTTT